MLPVLHSAFCRAWRRHDPIEALLATRYCSFNNADVGRVAGVVD
jgi:hypothetical protein